MNTTPPLLLQTKNVPLGDISDDIIVSIVIVIPCDAALMVSMVTELNMDIPYNTIHHITTKLYVNVFIFHIAFWRNET